MTLLKVVALGSRTLIDYDIFEREANNFGVRLLDIMLDVMDRSTSPPLDIMQGLFAVSGRVVLMNPQNYSCLSDTGRNVVITHSLLEAFGS